MDRSFPDEGADFFPSFEYEVITPPGISKDWQRRLDEALRRVTEGARRDVWNRLTRDEDTYIPERRGSP